MTAGKEMSEGAAEITNISNEQLKDAPKFKEVAYGKQIF